MSNCRVFREQLFPRFLLIPNHHEDSPKEHKCAKKCVNALSHGLFRRLSHAQSLKESAGAFGSYRAVRKMIAVNRKRELCPFPLSVFFQANGIAFFVEDIPAPFMFFWFRHCNIIPIAITAYLSFMASPF